MAEKSNTEKRKPQLFTSPQLFTKPVWQRRLPGGSPTAEELELIKDDKSFGTVFPPRSLIPTLLKGDPRPTAEEREAFNDLQTYGTPMTFGLKKHEDIEMASGARVPQDFPAPVNPASRTLWVAGMSTTGPQGHTAGVRS